MVTATILALVSAVLHASWNFLAKRSNDRLLALWGQFLAGGLIGAVILVAHGGIEAQAWGWAARSGAASARAQVSSRRRAGTGRCMSPPGGQREMVRVRLRAPLTACSVGRSACSARNSTVRRTGRVSSVDAENIT